MKRGDAKTCREDIHSPPLLAGKTGEAQFLLRRRERLAGLGVRTLSPPSWLSVVHLIPGRLHLGDDRSCIVWLSMGCDQFLPQTENTGLTSLELAGTCLTCLPSTPHASPRTGDLCLPKFTSLAGMKGPRRPATPCDAVNCLPQVVYLSSPDWGLQCCGL